MLRPDDQTLLDAAGAVAARLVQGDVSTVAAAAADSSGRVHTAANVFHFTGGPCAELALLGAVSAVTDDPVMTIVAVGNDGRGVLPPCGRCRQVLLDLHPHVRVLMPGDGGPVAVPVRELLPGAYAWGDAPAARAVPDAR
jgi:cytidine deaminase